MAFWKELARWHNALIKGGRLFGLKLSRLWGDSWGKFSRISDEEMKRYEGHRRRHLHTPVPQKTGVHGSLHPDGRQVCATDEPKLVTACRATDGTKPDGARRAIAKHEVAVRAGETTPTFFGASTVFYRISGEDDAILGFSPLPNQIVSHHCIIFRFRRYCA